MLFNVSDPIADILEGLLIGHIVNKENTHSTPIISLGDGTESLLTGCIPNLKLNSFAFELDRFDLKINAKNAHIKIKNEQTRW